jgi:large subunit ribosomal protein L4
MQVEIKNFDNKEAGKTELDTDIFGQEFRSDILARVVQWQRDRARSGCHMVKDRSLVTATTKKMYKQKGTGQARHGSMKAPIFVGGGTVFGPVVRSHGYSLNKKVRKLGLKIALSLKLRENSFIVLNNANVESDKTSDLSKKIKSFDSKSVLIIDSTVDEKLKLSSRNLKGVDVLPVMGLNVLDILKHDKVLMTVDALKEVEKRLSC